MKISRKCFWLIFIFLFFLIFGAGFLAGMFYNNDDGDKLSELRQKGNYKFINPLLECNFSSESNPVEYQKFSQVIKEKLDELSGGGSIKHISVYFRDLNNGPWFGYNENEKFTPASLLKVPLMMAYLKEAETDQNLFKKEMTFQQFSSEDGEISQNFKPKEKLEIGKKYSVDNLIQRMISYSDNNSARLLLENIDIEVLNEVYSDLSLSVPGSGGSSENYMTVKDYASFFRILYNASYLNKEMSEKALQFLSNSEFKDGLVAGVPDDITVSHKFGERKENNLAQLHDCGIIYLPEKPYLICIMTRGNNFEELKKTIKEISSWIYNSMPK